MSSGITQVVPVRVYRVALDSQMWEQCSIQIWCRGAVALTSFLSLSLSAIYFMNIATDSDAEKRPENEENAFKNFSECVPLN